MKRVIIDTNAIKHNYEVVRQRVGEDATVYFVVKGNAYGLDTKLYVNEMVKLGARHFAVADVSDGVYIKSFCPAAEVLLLTPVNTPQVAELVVKHRIVAAIENKNGAQLIGKFADEPYPVHIKIDVGFGRYGVRASDTDELKSICGIDKIHVVGAFTHLPKCADKHIRETQKMIDRFFDCVELMKSIGIRPKMIHALGSVGVFRFFDKRFTAVRIGSAITGRMPPVANCTGLKKVARLECSINSIKHIRKGESVGYSSLYKAKKDIVAAVVDVGYADGFSVLKIPCEERRIDVLRQIKHDLFNLARKPSFFAVIKEKNVKAIGSIGMTAASFDVTGLDIDYCDTAYIDVNPIYISSRIPRIYK